jgi:homoserine kinase
VLEAFAVPAPGGVRVEVSGVEVGEDVPSDHRNLAFIAAEKLLVRAGRSGHGVRLVLRKHIPAGSGSAYVVPVADARKLPVIVDAVSRRLRVPVVGTTSVTRGVRLSS